MYLCARNSYSWRWLQGSLLSALRRSYRDRLLFRACYGSDVNRNNRDWTVVAYLFCKQAWAPCFSKCLASDGSFVKAASCSGVLPLGPWTSIRAPACMHACMEAIGVTTQEGFTLIRARQMTTSAVRWSGYQPSLSAMLGSVCSKRKRKRGLSARPTYTSSLD